MARGNRALQAALGAIAGGFTGYAEDRKDREERERIARAEARQAALDKATAEREAKNLERQSALDRVALFNQGFLTRDESGTEQQRAGESLGRLGSMASSMMTPGAQLGALQTGDIRRIASAPGFQSPQQFVKLDGMEYQRESPIARATREAEQEMQRRQMAEERTKREQAQTRAQTREALKVAGVPESQIDAALSMGAKFGDVLETPADKQRRLQAERQYALDARRVAAAEQAAAAGPSGRRAAQRDKTELAATLPSVLEAADNFNKMDVKQVVKLRPGVMDAASASGKADGKLLGFPVGPLARYGVSTFLDPTTEELTYVQQANAVADAIARATDVGVLSNFDVDRFRTQVTPTALDAKNPKSAEFKFNVLKGWANWLANNQEMLKAADAAYESGKPLPDSQLRWKGAPPVAQGVGTLIGQQEQRNSNQQRSYTDNDRANRWDAIKRQNPSMTDDQITAQVRREMP